MHGRILASHFSLPVQDELIDKVAAFSFQVKEFLKYLCTTDICTSRVIAHFHEWMSGLAIPGIRKENLDVKIVFTTHATILGRYLAMNDNMFYDHLPLQLGKGSGEIQHQTH